MFANENIIHTYTIHVIQYINVYIMYLEHGEDSMRAFDSFSLASFTSSNPLADGGSVQVPCTSLDMVEYPSSRLPLSGVSSPSTLSHFVDSSAATNGSIENKISMNILF